MLQDAPVKPFVVGCHPGEREPPLGGGPALLALDLMHLADSGDHLLFIPA
jgi:hypothetical protein